jgi:hypothetical protein
MSLLVKEAGFERYYVCTEDNPKNDKLPDNVMAVAMRDTSLKSARQEVSLDAVLAAMEGRS